MAFTHIICILKTKIAVTLKTFSIRNLTFIQQEKRDLFLPRICRIITSKISITVQLLCVTNGSIAVSTWWLYWQTYNKFIYIFLTKYLNFSVFRRIILWVVQIKLMKWSDSKNWNHCHPLMQRKKNCKGDVKWETNPLRHESLMNFQGMLFFRPILRSSRRWEKLWCQVSGRKGMYGSKEENGQCYVHHEDTMCWVSWALEQHLNLYSLFLFWNYVLRCLIFWQERRVDVIYVCLVFWILATWKVLSSQ